MRHDDEDAPKPATGLVQVENELKGLRSGPWAGPRVLGGNGSCPQRGLVDLPVCNGHRVIRFSASIRSGTAETPSASTAPVTDFSWKEQERK